MLCEILIKSINLGDFKAVTCYNVIAFNLGPFFWFRQGHGY